MKHWAAVVVNMALVVGLSGCDDSEERRVRYAEKKPDPKPLERTFAPPPPVVPKEEREKVEKPSMVEYSGEDMSQITGLSGKKVLLVFYTPWCKSCAQYKDALFEYAEAEHGRCHIVAIDADKYPKLANEYGLQAVPKTILYVEGMKLNEFVGSVGKDRLIELIDKTLDAK